MTIIRVDLVGVELEAERKAELARRAIAAFCEIEVGRDVETAHTRFVVQINEPAADSVFREEAFRPPGRWRLVAAPGSEPERRNSGDDLLGARGGTLTL
jgi:hypothetical protein